MLKLIQHLTKSMCYETLKQVQGDKSGLFTAPSLLTYFKKKSIDRKVDKKWKSVTIRLFASHLHGSPWESMAEQRYGGVWIMR
jgi:hypothetical protein